MKIQSSAGDKPVVQANDYYFTPSSSPAAAYPVMARSADPDRSVIIIEPSASDMEAIRTEKLYNRYVWYSLLLILILCLLASIFVALGFAYIRFYENGDD
jgi:hypothetical protein